MLDAAGAAAASKGTSPGKGSVVALAESLSLSPLLLAPWLFGAAGLALGASLTAQSWASNAPATSPSPRAHGRIAHDLGRWVTVLFGGINVIEDRQTERVFVAQRFCRFDF